MEIGKKGERSVQNRCPGKAASALNPTQDSIFFFFFVEQEILDLDTQQGN